MNVYLMGVMFSLVVYIFVGVFVGRKVKDINDYYVAGRNAPTILIVGSLVASFLSTGAFLGDTGEVYAGFFVPIVIVGVIQATGYLWGSTLFGHYVRRSGVLTVPEYFGKRFASNRIRILSALTTVIAVSAYMLSAVQGISTLMANITGLSYQLCVIIAWATFTVFTIYSGSMGVLITDTIMFLVFLSAAIVAVPFISNHAGGWFTAIHNLSRSETVPGIISWHANLDYMFSSGVDNIAWAIIYGIVWALVVMVSPWQTSRYLMAKNENTVMRSAIWASMGVMITTVMLYFAAAFVQSINPNLVPAECMIWAAMNLMPTIIGVVLLAGILAAGISSASTFLSLIGFSLTNDLLPHKWMNEKSSLIISRIGMLVASLIILILAYLNPPQIFWIMYFGGTVIASSWGVVALCSVWSKYLSEFGAFLGMLLGFVVCVTFKMMDAFSVLDLPFWADAFILGIMASAVGMIIGSKLKPASAVEKAERELLFTIPDQEKDVADLRVTLKQSNIYLVYAVLFMIVFIAVWAMPYLGIL